MLLGSHFRFCDTFMDYKVLTTTRNGTMARTNDVSLISVITNQHFTNKMRPNIPLAVVIEFMEINNRNALQTVSLFHFCGQ